MHDSVNTLDQISTWESSLVGQLCCILCRRIAEDLDHFLWSYDFSRDMRRCFLRH